MAIIRRIKERLKKIALKKSMRRSKDTRLAKKPSAEEAKKEILGVQETQIEKAKFSHPEVAVSCMRRGMPKELPSHYDQDKIVLQVRDPWWIHAYWEIRYSTIERLRSEFKDEFDRARRLLRVYDVTDIIFDGNNARSFFDIQVNDFTNNWYIDTGGPGRSWCIDLGLLLPSEKFITIVRSNIVRTPLAGPSWITDEEWMIPEDMFARLYGMGFGLGRSSPVGKAWQERIKHLLSSGVSSPGVTSVTSPAKRAFQEKKFWLVVDCELIVYGATEPDAKVTVQGKPIALRQDGTFTLRFALPNGKQVIPVKAVSSDGEDERTITPIVTRETR